MKQIIHAFIFLFCINLHIEAYANLYDHPYYRDQRLNLCNGEWWETASVDDVEQELENNPQWDINENKCDISYIRYKGKKLIHLASEYSKDEKVIQLLIDKGANVNLRNGSFTPLMFAATNNNLAAAKILIKNGAKINLESEGGYTALQAAWRSNKNMIKLLLEQGSDVNHRNKDGDSVLITYISYRPDKFLSETKIETIKFLISEGADIHYVNKNKAAEYPNFLPVHYVTPLMAEIKCLKDYKKDYSVIDFLLEQKVDVNVKDEKGRTALSQALLCNQREIADKIINAGADIKQVDGDGNNLLAQVAKYSPLKQGKEFIDYIISKGIDINAQNNKGETALILACQRGTEYSDNLIKELCERDNYQGFISALLKAGADLTIKDNKGKTALDYAEANPLVRCSDAYWMIKDSFSESQKSNQQNIQNDKISKTPSQELNNNFISPINFEDTPENREMVISYIKYCVKETYCETEDECNPIILRMMEQANLASFKNIMNPSNVSLMKKTLSTYCYDGSCCPYTIIEMMYNQMLQSENTELEW